MRVHLIPKFNQCRFGIFFWHKARGPRNTNTWNLSPSLSWYWMYVWETASCIHPPVAFSARTFNPNRGASRANIRSGPGLTSPPVPDLTEFRLGLGMWRGLVWRGWSWGWGCIVVGRAGPPGRSPTMRSAKTVSAVREAVPTRAIAQASEQSPRSRRRRLRTGLRAAGTPLDSCSWF